MPGQGGTPPGAVKLGEGPVANLLRGRGWTGRERSGRGPIGSGVATDPLADDPLAGGLSIDIGRPDDGIGGLGFAAATGPGPSDAGPAGDAAAGDRGSVDRPQIRLATMSDGPWGPPAERIPATPPTRPQYDGEGTLRAISRSDRRTPPFALTDERGSVVRLVVPSPGLNLHRYAGRRVGIFGRVRTVEGMTAPVVVAERIVDLQRHGE